MTAEARIEREQVEEMAAVSHQEEPEKIDESKLKSAVKSSSYREESNVLSDLREMERKALTDLRSKLEDAILHNKLFEHEEPKKEESLADEKAKGSEKKGGVCGAKEAEEGKKSETEAGDGGDQDSEVKEDRERDDSTEADDNKMETKENGMQAGEEKEEREIEVKEGEGEESKEEEPKVGEEKADKEGNKETEEVTDKEGEHKTEERTEANVIIDRDISLWGVPLLPSKQAKGTDVVLLKFLRARDFKVSEAFEMLKKTLRWRKSNNVDSIADEDFGSDLNSAAYMKGLDREGHPVCYNIHGAFGSEELYQKTFGSKESRVKFLRWRFQLMEKGIQKLDFRPDGVSSLLQIHDLKNTPGLPKKESRMAVKMAILSLQDNYPELVARNVIVNAPFWFYALNALVSPFLTQRSKSKFVVARPGKVTEILLKYIPAEELPVQYGGFMRENDSDFSTREDGAVAERIVKAGSTETIEIPANERGNTLVWDVVVLGWEVNYKEEFVPSDEGSYTMIVQKGKKVGANEGTLRNSFRNGEVGKIVLTVENVSGKKKRVLYRYKTRAGSGSSV